MRNLLVLLSCLAGSGCAGYLTDHIPATATPAREARYYQDQPARDAALGVLTDEGLRVVFHDHAGPSWAPFVRMLAVGGLGMLSRATWTDYRESGLLFTVSGAVSWEVVRCIFAPSCRTTRGRQ